MTFSPDGLSAAFRQGGWLGGIWVTRIPGGRRTQIADSAGGGGIDWSTDGWVYFTNTSRGISRARADGEGEEQVVTIVDGLKGEAVHVFPESLPDGRGILFTIRYRDVADLDQSYIAVLDFESGAYWQLEQGIR